MRKISEPNISLSDLYGKCAATIASGDLKSRLNEIYEDLKEAERLYKERAPTSALYLFEESNGVGRVSKDELSKLYSQTFVREGGPTRDLYEKLRAAPGSICPLCNQRVVSTLDHYLPKAKHPAFAVTPCNLVPACKDCNIDSQQKRPARAEEQTLHPYFDDVDAEVWLYADVIEASPPAISFEVRNVGSWNAVKNNLISSHFSTYKLASLYSSHAGAELVNVYVDIEDAGLLGRQEETKAHLLNQAKKRRRAFRNSWQAALYDGLAASDWFCSEGIKEVTKCDLFPAGS